MQFRDDMGAEIGSNICHIIGSDGGTMPDALNHRMPHTGLLTDVAYRWDIICDFSNYKDSVSTLLMAFQSSCTCAGPGMQMSHSTQQRPA